MLLHVARRSSVWSVVPWVYDVHMGFESGHIARVVLRATNGANEIVSTLHYDLTGNALDDAPSLQNLADRIRDALVPAWKACIIPSWTVQPVEVIDEKDPLHPDALRSAVASGTAAAGTRLAPPSGEVLPIEACGMLTLRTDHIGRSFRGRMFLPPVWSDASIDNGVLAGSQFTNYGAVRTAIPLAPDVVTGPSTATAHLCIYSRTRRARSASDYAAHVSSITLDNTVRWLRSRG